MDEASLGRLEATVADLNRRINELPLLLDRVDVRKDESVQVGCIEASGIRMTRCLTQPLLALGRIY